MENEHVDYDSYVRERLGQIAATIDLTYEQLVASTWTTADLPHVEEGEWVAE